MEMNYDKYQMMDMVQEMILVIEKQGSILYVNPPAKEEFGFEQEENLSDLKITKLFPLLFHENDTVSQVLQEIAGQKIETMAYRQNETCYEARVQIYRLPNEEDVYLCSIANLHLVKEQQREIEKASSKVAAANEVRNEFVANVTHELRTPVNGIKGHVKYLLDTPALNKECRDTLKIVEHCCENMEKIINNLLDFSKMEAGKFSIEENEFSLQKCIEHVIATNISQANAKGINLEARIAEGIPEQLLGDELRITQILNNLISNAIKFTSIGKVKVEIVKSAQYGNEIEIFMMVIDTGIGIALEDRDKLFKSFSQVDGSITRKFGGTGLGLAVTKNLVEMMGGKINVESSPGKGSTFACSIILHTLQAEAMPIPAAGEKMLIKPDLSTMMLAGREMNMDKIYQFGSRENLKEIQKNMEKLVLCMEMETWTRAEEFADKLKQLVKEGGDDMIKLAFRLEMCVRKENYQKSMEYYEEFRKMLPES